MAQPARADKSSLPPELGYNYGQVEDARWAAMNGALHALSNGNTAVFSNPANLTYSQVYHVGALAQIWPEARRQSYGAAAMDSVTSRLAAGVGFVWNDQDPDGLERRWSDLRLALAYPFSDRVAFGMAGRYLKLEQQGLGPLGQSYASGGLTNDAIVNGFSFDAGLRLGLSDNVIIGAVGQNLSNPGNGFQPTSFGGGIGIIAGDLALEFDGLSDFTTYETATARVMAGGEFLAGDHFPIRLGYRFDQGAETHAVSLGLGYIDPSFSVDVAARRFVAGEEATTIVFSLQYFVESSGLTRTPTADF